MDKQYRAHTGGLIEACRDGAEPSVLRDLIAKGAEFNARLLLQACKKGWLDLLEAVGEAAVRSVLEKANIDYAWKCLSAAYRSTNVQVLLFVCCVTKRTSHKHALARLVVCLGSIWCNFQVLDRVFDKCGYSVAWLVWPYITLGITLREGKWRHYWTICGEWRVEYEMSRRRRHGAKRLPPPCLAYKWKVKGQLQYCCDWEEHISKHASKKLL